ncbi:hypothetical protein WICPIJ_006648 [Wickerhamomyces pijperi]|uniref:Uncharacterized protein n=1 Tax=Wickerhamomyces pijperi TaxID=599730 RepID=A0A9P8TKS6_WICPI|nr:hypothetical protein WICPIJ_006648 [Wickerhamomyces pijperi]
MNNIPKSSATTSYLRSVVIYSLDNDLIPSAEFAVERLMAETGNEDNDVIHLYGLVLLRLKRFKTAYNLTINRPHIGCLFVFAKSALALEMGNEGVRALTSSESLWKGVDDYEVKEYQHDRRLIPDPAVFYSLLGRLHYLVGDIKESCIAHSKALKRNPYIWESFEELNRMGANVKVKGVYKAQEPSSFPLSVPLSGYQDSGNSKDPFGDSVPFNPRAQHSYQHVFQQAQNKAHLNETDNDEFTTPVLKQSNAVNAPARKTTSSMNPISTAKDIFKRPPAITSATDSTKRQTRLTSAKVTSRLTQPLSGGNTFNSTTGQRRLSNSEIGSKRSSKTFLASNNLNNTDSFKKGLRADESGETRLLQLYATYAKGLKSMYKYDCFKAIRVLTSLPLEHLNTPWVLSKLGRLHYEIVNYEEAELYFKKLRKIDRTRLEDMEYYSTLLWHLHKENDLCFLSYELAEIDRNAPQTWVAIGNMFSLTKEPDEAIKCFERAVQIDSKFSYAYTLQGHEYVGTDAYENALDSFRMALLTDPRHYNALYGIGMVYLKLGNFNRAEFHFRKAVDINPINVILICCVGMMLEKLGKRDHALEQYKLACKIQPLSALALFKKAQLLFSLEHYNEALKDFEYLVTITPDEASVHFLLGQLYKLARRNNEAIKQFTIALNLDPKGGHLVKEALESLNAVNVH